MFLSHILNSQELKCKLLLLLSIPLSLTPFPPTSTFSLTPPAPFTLHSFIYFSLLTLLPFFLLSSLRPFLSFLLSPFPFLLPPFLSFPPSFPPIIFALCITSVFICLHTATVPKLLCVTSHHKLRQNVLRLHSM